MRPCFPGDFLVSQLIQWVGALGPIVGACKTARCPHHSRPWVSRTIQTEGVPMRVWRLGIAAALAFVLAGCGYNEIQSRDEAVKAAWSEVLSQYQRRADLVNTVKGEANFEKETLTRVIEARAKATSIQVTPELANDPAALQKFQQAQGELSSALSRLLVVSENYPNLKSNQSFQELSAQLEGTENRIAIARNRYIKAVQDYNVYIRQLPQNLTAKMFGYKEKPQFTVENEEAVKQVPKVDFGTK